MVVLPFSGWDWTNQSYNNGLQLIDFTASSITTGGAAHTRGWVERGIFVNNRLVSLSDLSLAVVDYTNHAAPTVVDRADPGPQRHHRAATGAQHRRDLERLVGQRRDLVRGAR